MASGKIKFFNRKKGFGFILDDETNNDIFFHASAFADKKLKLKAKQSVFFEIYTDEKEQLKAKDIRTTESLSEK